MSFNPIFSRKTSSRGGILLLLLIFSTICIYCQKKQADIPHLTKPVFDSIPATHPLVPEIGEISGIADSKVNPGYLWGEQDSNKPPLLFLISHDGKVKKQIFLKGVKNRDWEDMVLSEGRIYIGDIGDNSLKQESYYFYYFKEPKAAIDTVYEVKDIRFKYPDGSHNAEAFLVDDAANAIFILTKNDNPSRIYKLSLSGENSGEMLAAELVGKLNYSGVVSACQSPDGKEIIVKTYFGLQYYKRKSGQTLLSALSEKYIHVPYIIEPQGEAVCFALDNSGYFTLSEKGFANFVKLYFYKRN